MKIFTHAFYIGTAMKSGIEKMHSSNSEVFNGVDNHLYRNTGNNRKKQIIAVGSLKKEKGYDYLIRGYKIFLDQFPTIKYKLLIAGEGYLRKNLTSLINTLELKTRVKLLGNLAQAELVSLYNESEIFILSSISEGFPKVLLEANSCGCKIIATDVGSIRSIINNPIATKSPDAIAVAISDSIKNYNVNVLPEVAKFTWENVAKLYKNTYDKFTHS